MRRYRLALFISFLEGIDYVEPLWHNVHKRCKERDINLVLFPGRNLGSEDKNLLGFNKVFNFFKSESFDGLIIASGTLLNLIPSSNFDAFLDKYSEVPILSISLKSDKASSIIIDNKKGMSLIAEHMVEHHNYRRFAYLSGTRENSESIDRLTGFREKLAEYDITLSEENIFYGDFTRYNLDNILKPLLEREDLGVDALVCATDNMAMGAIDLLKESGYRIPRDIAVTGFDNSISAVSQSPTITSIDQPVGEIGRESVDIILDILSGETKKKEILKAPYLVIKESCGCNYRQSENPQNSFPLLKGIFNNIISDKKDQGILKEIQPLESVLFHDLIRDIHDDFQYVKEVKDILFGITDSNYAKRFIDIHNHLFKVLEHSIKDKHKKFVFRKMKYILSSSFKSYTISRLKQDAILYGESIVELRNDHQQLLTSENLTALFDIIARTFKKYGMENYYISMYTKRERGDELKLMFAMRDGEFLDCLSNDKDCTYKDFIPEKYLPHEKRTTLVTFPLYSNNKYFGFMVLQVSSLNASFYEDLQMNISSALMSIISLEERIEAEKQLQNSLDELKQTQKQLIESEKLASLGNLIAGLAHEMNTPVGISLTSSSYLEDIIQVLKKHYSVGKLQRTDFETFFQDAFISTELIHKNLNKTITLINKFKNISVHSVVENRSTFSPYQTLVMHKKSISKELRINSVIMNIDCDKDLIINTYQNSFKTLFYHLIENSFTHGFTQDTTDRTINISLKQIDNTLLIYYMDNGVGITSNETEKIFNPFYTTERSSGHTGLGLSLIYNLINTLFKGSIEVVSNRDRGLVYNIILDVK